MNLHAEGSVTPNDNATSIEVAQPAIALPYALEARFAAVMPALDQSSYETLKTNIRTAGEVIAPLVVWKETMALVDGFHRHRAWSELIAEGIEIPCPSIKLMSFASAAEASVWILQHAVGTRQNFGTFQKIHQIFHNAELMDTLTSAAEQRMLSGKKADPGATVAPGSNEEKAAIDAANAKVAKQIAKAVNCSETTAKEALAVCRHGEFVEAIQNGVVTAHSAYRAIRGHAEREQAQQRIEQNLPQAHLAVEKLAKETGTLLGKVHHCDVLVGLKQLPDRSVSVVITSPPYALAGVKYPNWEYPGYPAYLDWMRQVFAECERVLVRGGKLIVNFDNCNIPPNEREGNEVRRDLRRDFANIAADLRLLFVDEYFWAKQNAVGTRPAIGTKGSPSGTRVNNNCEYVCVWAKEQVQKAPERTDVPEKQLIDLTIEEQFRLSMQLWPIKPVCRKESKHRAAFPEELVRRLILLYTFLEDTVVDPFSGSGTTCAMAARMGRKFVGFDNAKQYNDNAAERVAEALKNPVKPPVVPEWEFNREMKRARNAEIFRAMQRRTPVEAGKADPTSADSASDATHQSDADDENFQAVA